MEHLTAANITEIATAVGALAAACSLLFKRVREGVKLVGMAVVDVVKKIKDALRGGPGGPTAAAVLMLITLSGCSVGTAVVQENALLLFEKVQEKGAAIEDKVFDNAARTIDGYCANVGPLTRTALRAAVNTRTENGDIHVDCVIDDVAP